MKEQKPHKPTVEYLTTYMHENFATKEDLANVEERLNIRIDKLEIRINNIETSVNKILEILTNKNN